MKQSLSCALVQMDIAWHDFQANCDKVQQITNPISADIFVLPEMFHVGFTMEPQKVSEEEQKKVQEFCSQLAKEKNALIIAGTVVGNASYGYYNRLFAFFPDGTINTYDKRHLFSFAGEHEHYNAGKERLVIEYLGWRINPLICYDLRFPVFARNSAVKPFDLQLFIANWPQARVSAWDALLTARAIENQCYLIGVNRVGEDGKGITYNGHSAAIDPYGNYVAGPIENETVLTVELNKKLLDDFRVKFPVLGDADGFTLTE
ncbi:amidohydrolase [Luteibaculum oceani]|uniref:Omega-amidase YafV n=1 Tax=Luteibaculum oceani TaxID=1294296 RepID=A0A5C6V5M7_9FLAO|nr:amidohydrolase [Luteibaculum oceani]TXC78985.1 amidohydrolase [Luteibaculum oceani]